jgi:hypothetical protein
MYRVKKLPTAIPAGCWKRALVPIPSAKPQEEPARVTV